MVEVFEIRVDDRRVKTLMNNIQFKLPKEVHKEGFLLLKKTATSMKLILRRRKNVWRGKLLESIRAEQSRSGHKSVLKMAKRGVYLDRMRPHWVKLKRGRLIRKWAYEKGHAGVQRAADAQASIFVKPHPFIDVAINRNIIKLKQSLRRAVNRSVKV